jgi:hypothetical protein
MDTNDRRTGYYQDWIDSAAYHITAVTYRDGGFSIHATLITETIEQAREAAARFPKSTGARANTLTGHDALDHESDDPRYTPETTRTHLDGGRYYHGWTTGHVSITFHLTSNGVTGTRNETALKRYRSFRKNAGKLEIPVVFDGGLYGNSVPTEADLDALLAAY